MAALISKNILFLNKHLKKQTKNVLLQKGVSEKSH